MTTIISRHTSSVSLVSQNALHIGAGLLVQCLNGCRGVIESGCERLLEIQSRKCDPDTLTKNDFSIEHSSQLLSPVPSPLSSSLPNNNVITVTQVPICLDVEARETLAQHLIELFATLVLPDPPRCIDDVDRKLFDGGGLPNIPDKMMPTRSDLNHFRNLATKRRTRKLHLPVNAIHAAFKEFNESFNISVSIYLVAVAEHIISQFLQAAICFEVRTLRGNSIRASTVETLFKVYRDRIRPRRRALEPKFAHRFPQDYDRCVDLLDRFLHTTLEQMTLILRVFREPIALMHGSLSTDSHQSGRDEHPQITFGYLLDLYHHLRILQDDLDAEEDDPLPPTTTPKPDGAATDRLTNCGRVEPASPSDHFTSPDSLSTCQRCDVVSNNCRFLIDNRHRRLVGIGLIELAEDDSLHAFSQYASCALNPIGLDRIWMMVEKGMVVPWLCHLSHTILRTTSSANKTPTATELHALTCKRCSFRDVLSLSRRRSVSTTILNPVDCQDECPTARNSIPDSKNNNQDASSRKPPTPVQLRIHRSSHSSDSTQWGCESAACNYLVNCFKYLLPRLLLLPIFNFFYLHELIKTLHQCTSVVEDRARLLEVLSMLNKTRSSLDRDLAKNPWAYLHLMRLMSTGYLVGEYRSLYMDLLYGMDSPPSPVNAPTASSPCPSMSNSVNNHAIAFAFAPLSDTPSHKLDEIERHLGLKDKFSEQDRCNIGEFVVESRIQLVYENKRSSMPTEHIAYLFNGSLLICKERRNPASGHRLREKLRISLDFIHLTDLPPIIQPNAMGYIGPSWSATSSMVDAAISAAASASHSPSSVTTTSHGHSHADLYSSTISNSLHSGLVGSMFSQASLVNTSTHCLPAYPYQFELEYVDHLSSAHQSTYLAAMPAGQNYHHHHHPSCTRFRPPNHPTSINSTDESHRRSVNIDPLDSSEALGSVCSCQLTRSKLHRVILAFRTAEEKADWMASLLSIQLNRLLIRYIRTLPKIEVKLRLPSASVYRFAEPDSSDNIVFEENCTITADAADLTAFDSSEDECSLHTDSEESEDDVLVPTLIKNRDSHPPCEDHKTKKLSTADLGGSDVGTLCPTQKRDRSYSKPPLSQSNTVTAPQIQTATLVKLVERLTYPNYFDSRAVNTFLLTYRRVTNAEELFDLLVERFRIPDPQFSPEELELGSDSAQLESSAQHMLKRFRSSYKKRVQIRVVMFLSRWVRNPRYYQYDFQPHPKLCARLADFLSGIQARHLIGYVGRIRSHINPPIHDHCLSPTSSSCATDPNSSSDCSTPLPVPHAMPATSTCPVPSEPYLLDITTIHPYKLAEQITLYEWELYRAIQFWEVEGCNRSSAHTPNLERSKQFSNRFWSWLVYAILAEPHPDDRAVVIQRVIDLMLIMEKMNNLQGSQEAKSALISGPIYRLKKSFNLVRRIRSYRKVLDRLFSEFSTQTKSTRKSPSASLHADTIGSSSTSFLHTSIMGLSFADKVSKACRKRMRALELRHAHGDATHACVPFIAAGVTNRLIHLDLRHPDTIKGPSDVTMVNCWKHRQLAEIVERYLAFQRTPYLFSMDMHIRKLLENLDPFDLIGASSAKEFEDYMYKLSEGYEARETDSTSESFCSTVTADRRLSKEAIQAANLLSNISLKERMSVQSMFAFTDTISSSLTSSTSSSRVFTPSRRATPISFGLKSPPACSSPIQNNQQRHPSLHDQSGLGPGGVSTPAIIHLYSLSDSQMLSSAKRSNISQSHQLADHSIADATMDANPTGYRSPSNPTLSESSSNPILTSGLPPPLPPRKYSAGMGSRRATQRPLPLNLYNQQPPQSRVMTVPSGNSSPLDAVGPPPLPPKSCKITHSHIVDNIPPPLPPRRVVSTTQPTKP